MAKIIYMGFSGQCILRGIVLFNNEIIFLKNSYAAN